MFGSHPGGLNFFTHQLLRLLSAALPARRDRRVPGECLSEGIIGFEHHVLRLLKSRRRFNAGNFGGIRRFSPLIFTLKRITMRFACFI